MLKAQKGTQDIFEPCDLNLFLSDPKWISD